MKTKKRRRHSSSEADYQPLKPQLIPKQLRQLLTTKSLQETASALEAMKSATHGSGKSLKTLGYPGFGVADRMQLYGLRYGVLRAMDTSPEAHAARSRLSKFTDMDMERDFAQLVTEGGVTLLGTHYKKKGEGLVFSPSMQFLGMTYTEELYKARLKSSSLVEVEAAHNLSLDASRFLLPTYSILKLLPSNPPPHSSSSSRKESDAVSDMLRSNPSPSCCKQSEPLSDLDGSDYELGLYESQSQSNSSSSSSSMEEEEEHFRIMEAMAGIDVDLSDPPIWGNQPTWNDSPSLPPKRRRRKKGKRLRQERMEEKAVAGKHKLLASIQQALKAPLYDASSSPYRSSDQVERPFFEQMYRMLAFYHQTDGEVFQKIIAAMKEANPFTETIYSKVRMLGVIHCGVNLKPMLAACAELYDRGTAVAKAKLEDIQRLYLKTLEQQTASQRQQQADTEQRNQVLNKLQTQLNEKILKMEEVLETERASSDKEEAQSKRVRECCSAQVQHLQGFKGESWCEECPQLKILCGESFPAEGDTEKQLQLCAGATKEVCNYFSSAINQDRNERAAAQKTQDLRFQARLRDKCTSCKELSSVYSRLEREGIGSINDFCAAGGGLYQLLAVLPSAKSKPKAKAKPNPKPKPEVSLTLEEQKLEVIAPLVSVPPELESASSSSESEHSTSSSSSSSEDREKIIRLDPTTYVVEAGTGLSFLRE